VIGIDVAPEWRRHLARQVKDLGPMTHGRYLPESDVAQEQISGEWLLDADYLRTAIARARPAVTDPPEPENPKDRDLRICSSRMSRQYCAALTTVALAGLANGVGIDLSPARCTVIFRDNLPSQLALAPAYRADEVLRCARRPTTWPVSGPAVASVEELREHVWTNLYARNLRPLFAAAVGTVKAPERLLWTNAAEWVAIVMDAAVDHLEPAAAAVVVAEGRALLEAESLPGFAGAPNPLRGRLEWVPFDDDGFGFRQGVQTRHLCCLVYLHTDRHGRLCQNCPFLPLSDRAALVRERRGMDILEHGGPAEQRSIEVGLRRRGRQR
jgi:hypothetical protein